MTNQYIVTGKTVEEAMAAAHAQYGSDGEVSYEIMEMPKKGFLGLRSTPAKIRVTVTEEDKLSLDSILADVRGMKRVTDKGSDGGAGKMPAEKPAAPGTPAAAQPRQDSQRPGQRPGGQRQDGQRQDGQRQGNPGQNRPAQGKGQMNRSAPQNRPAANPASAPAEKPASEPVAATPITEEEMACAVSFAEGLLRSMELDARVVRQTAADGTPVPRLNIEGDDTGILIGHHGETLDAIQYLVNLSANRRGGSGDREFVKIAVDVENYREKREETLRALARRMADKCKKYKKNIVLEPMNPYERRIIHSEIQDIADVSTHSVGYDENRKIVVTYEGADKPAEPQRGAGRKRHSRGSGNGGNGTSGGSVSENGIRTLPQPGYRNNRGPVRPAAPVAPVAQPVKPQVPEYPDDLDTDDIAAADYTYEKKSTPKPEKMSLEDFMAVAPEDIPMGILSRKPEDGENKTQK